MTTNDLGLATHARSPGFELDSKQWDKVNAMKAHLKSLPAMSQALRTITFQEYKQELKGTEEVFEQVVNMIIQGPPPTKSVTRDLITCKCGQKCWGENTFRVHLKEAHNLVPAPWHSAKEHHYGDHSNAYRTASFMYQCPYCSMVLQGNVPFIQHAKVCYEGKMKYMTVSRVNMDRTTWRKSSDNPELR